MSWPVAGDYYEAIQNASFCFPDAELRSGSPPMLSNGLPKYGMTGAFASVYKMNCGPRKWAVRCFLKQINDQERRYSVISAHLKSVSMPCMVGFEYLREGIKVRGRPYPILKMEWVEGQELHNYIAANLHQPNILHGLTRQWIDLMASLKKNKIAHGDLQHGNVLVANGQLRLLDYDGMYVPSLSGMVSNEEGHRNYQHPKRTGSFFNLQTDNFSAWVIFVSLSALTLEPRLWQVLNGGDDCLLFRREDFEKANQSHAFRSIETSPRPELQVLAAQFRSLLTLPLSQIPSLDGAAVAVPSVASTPRIAGNIPNWLSDHVSHATETISSRDDLSCNLSIEEHRIVAEPAVADASWLFEHLVTQTPLTPILNEINVKRERKIAIFGAAITALIVPAVFFHLWISLAFLGIAPFATLVYLFLRYRQTNIFGEMQTIIRNIKATEHELKTKRGTIDLIQAQRYRLLDPLRKLDVRYRHISAESQKQLALIKTDFEHQLQNESDERKDFTDKESAELQRVDLQLNSETSEIVQLRNSSNQSEQAEIAYARSRISSNHRTSQLAAALVSKASLPGIGPKLKNILLAAGVYTAADVDNRIYNIRGFGRDRIATLRAWRIAIENQAVASTPDISQSELGSIHAKYVGQQQQFNAKLAGMKQREYSMKQAISDKYSHLYREVDQKESELRFDTDRKSAAVHARSEEDRIRIKQEFKSVEIKLAREQAELDHKITDINTAIYRQQMQKVELKRQLTRYRNITFSGFVKKVILIA